MNKNFRKFIYYAASFATIASGILMSIDFLMNETHNSSIKQNLVINNNISNQTQSNENNFDQETNSINTTEYSSFSKNNFFTHEKRIAVLPIDRSNRSSLSGVDERSYSILRSGVEAAVQRSGIIQLERELIDSFIEEIQYQQSHLVNSNKKVKIGKQLGATHLVYSQISNIERIENHTKSYNTEFSTISTTASIFVKLINLETGSVRSREFTGDPIITMNSKYGGTQSNGEINESMRSAIKFLIEDEFFDI